MIVTIGGGISNSQIITEEGKYALDAVQNNPNVEGSLRNEINIASEKLDSMEMIKKFYTVRSFNVNSGTNGYVKVATIKITSTYCDGLLIFEVSGRRWQTAAQLYIIFNSSLTHDNTINSFKYVGWITDVALCKLNNSTWELYIKKIDEYDYICIHRYNYNYNFFNLVITFPGDFAESLPANAVHPTSYQ